MSEYLTTEVENFAVWRGPEHGEDDGIEIIPKGLLYYAALQIKGFPDLSLNRDLSKFDFMQRDKIIFNYQQKFIDTLHKIGHERVSFSLRFILNPHLPFEERISLFLIVRMFVEKENEEEFLHILRQIPNIFPTQMGIYHTPALITDEETLKLVIECAQASKYIAEIRKREKMFIPYQQIPGIKYVYIPFNFDQQLNAMIRVCEAMVKHNEPVVLDTNLIPTNLTAYEQHALKTLVINFDKLQREQKISVGEGDMLDGQEPVEVPADPIIKLAFDTYKGNLYSYSASGVFLLSCRVASNSRGAVESIITLMGRSSSKDFDYELLDLHNPEELEASRQAILHCDISIATYNNDIWDRPGAPGVIRRLHRMSGFSEANSFFALPIPSIQGVPGFPITSRPGEVSTDSHGAKGWYEEHHDIALNQNEIILGNIGLRGESLREFLALRIKDLAKHGLIIGVPGSGKTTTCFHLLYQLTAVRFTLQ